MKYILILLIVCKSMFAQNNEPVRLTIPLSHPDRPMILNINHYKGSIRITGYRGNVALVEAVQRYSNPEQSRQKGMTRISSHSLKLRGAEKNNEVTIESNSETKTIDMDIKVPFNCSLRLHLFDNGEIVVNNLSGEFEISNINGRIELNHVKGSAVLNTVDGNILANFITIKENTPMAFSSVEGHIELSLAHEINAYIKAKTDHGEVYSDFEMQLEPRRSKEERNAQTGEYQISLTEWIHGKINNGGPELLLKSYYGNIYLRTNN